MEEKKTLKMLFHTGYHDGPLDGLAEYDGKEVYFKRREEWLLIEPDAYPADIRDRIVCAEDFETKYHYYDADDDYVYQKPTYDIFYMDDVSLTTYKERNRTFNEWVGYQNWHDPGVYRASPIEQRRPDWMDYYKENPHDYGWNPTLEYIDTFVAEDFQYFRRPVHPATHCIMLQ